MNKYALSIVSATLSAGIVMGVMSCSSNAAPTPVPTSSDAPHITPRPRPVNTPTEMPAPVITANPRPTNNPPVIITQNPLVTRHPRPVNTPPVIVTPSTNLCGAN